MQIMSAKHAQKGVHVGHQLILPWVPRVARPTGSCQTAALSLPRHKGEISSATMELLESSPIQPPECKRFTRQQRDEYIRQSIPLPPAMRVPTERSLQFFLKTILCDPTLFAILAAYRDSKPVVVKAIAATLIKQIQPLCEVKVAVSKVVRGTLLSTHPGNYYSLEATQTRLRHADYAECCARDHYTRGSYGKRFHAFIIYRFILFVQTKSEALRSAIDTTSVCVVCQSRAARVAQEGGEPVMWRQAEPCRHWTCDSCTRELIHSGQGEHCAQCRTKVISYTKGCAPAGNRD